MSEQLYLIRISAMLTSEECDVVPSAQIIVDGDFSTSETPIFENLQKLAASFANGMKDLPVTDLRPMTREEIREWQKEQAEEDDY